MRFAPNEPAPGNSTKNSMKKAISFATDTAKNRGFVQHYEPLIESEATKLQIGCPQITIRKNGKLKSSCEGDYIVASAGVAV
ncbi:hypothetical protein TNCV_3626881 [Trichonephila clavipes]|nr:hypothetical protein TNCV_3626881 [Trichonephila clavipes]